MVEILNIRHEINAISPNIQYLELLIQPGILPCSPNCLPLELNANSTLGLLTSSTLIDMWFSMEPFRLLSLSRLEHPKAVF